ncbi:MAG: hypothetical protein WCS87_07780 [Methylococcaceae bacterium]
MAMMKAGWLQDRVARDESGLASVFLSGSSQHESRLASRSGCQ